jgi:hypothetical protein
MSFSCKRSPPKGVTVSNTKGKKLEAVDHITGILDISKDTILLVKSYKTLLLTTNFGKTWKDISPRMIIYDVTIDHLGVLWINSTGGGIHEPKYSYYLNSIDSGKHWNTISWDPDKFWPVHILSKPHQPLKVITGENKIFQLTGTDVKKDWRYLDSLEEDELPFQSEQAPPYYIDSYWPGHMKLYKKQNGEADTLAHLDSLYSVGNIEKYGKNVYVAGSGPEVNGVYKEAYLAILSHKRNLKKYTLPGHYAYVKIGYKGRVWVNTGEHLYWMKDGQPTKFY